MIPLDGIHRNAASLSFLIYSEFPHGIKGVRLSSRPVTQAEAEVENRIFDRWAAADWFGRPPVCLESGVLTSVRASSRIDFREASFEEFLVSGFSWWDGSFRWTTGPSKVRLQRAGGALAISVSAPVDRLRQKFPALRAIHVRVNVDDAPIGQFSIETDQTADYRLEVPVRMTQGSGTAVITLQPDLIWHARDLDPRSLDDRDLSFALLSIGFAGNERRPVTSCESERPGGGGTASPRRFP